MPLLDNKPAICDSIGTILTLSLESDHSGMDHYGSQIHLLLQRVRVGFSPYLQHMMGYGWPTGSLETLGGVPTL